MLQHIKLHLNKSLDPFQFAYQRNRCVENAVNCLIHYALKHLEMDQQRTSNHTNYVRILFVDYSSAFNTIVPSKLYRKLCDLNLPNKLCVWLLDFLLQRKQQVRLNGSFSQSLVLNTGTPQGCCLSPLLFTLFTYDCKSESSQNLILKFADDTSLIGQISHNDESTYRTEVDSLVQWCSLNNLSLNVKKTKEIVIDYRRNTTEILPLKIHGEEVEIVPCYKYLGTQITNELSWETQITQNLKKSQKRLHFLRQLKSFQVNKSILTTFYQSAVESCLVYGILIWYSAANIKDIERLQRLTNTASYIIGVQMASLTETYKKRIIKRVTNIMKDENHPLNNFFEELPSGRRLRSARALTSRFLNTFVPSAIRCVNGKQ